MKKSNLIGGVGKATPFLQDDELGPVLDPNATVESQITGTSAEIAQEQIDANQGPMVGNTPQYEIDYGAMSQEDFETIMGFAPYTGEVIDAKNTLVDLYKGDYTGAALNAAGFLIPFIPGAVLKKGAKEVAAWAKKNGGDIMDKLKGGGKIDDLVKTYNPGGMDKVLENQKMEFMNTASDKDIVSSKLFTQDEKAEILGSRYKTNAGGVSGSNYAFSANQKNVFSSTSADSKLKNTYRNEAGNSSTAIYENADGVEDVVISAVDDNNYVAFSKGDGPDGEWTSKMEVSIPGKFKQMLLDAAKRLPEGAVLTEKTSISADGISVWSKFDGKGWKPTGKTKKVYLAKLNAKGDHDKVLFTTKEAANKKIAELKKVNPNIEYTIGNGPPPPPGGDRKLFINLELPTLEKVGTSNTNATGGVTR